MEAAARDYATTGFVMPYHALPQSMHTSEIAAVTTQLASLNHTVFTMAKNC
jgi:hypothetical protein